MKCLSLILLFLIYTTCDATLLTFLRRKFGFLFPPKPTPIYHPLPPSLHPAKVYPGIPYPANLHPVPVSIQPTNTASSKYPQHPIMYTIIPTGVAGPTDIQSGTILPGVGNKNGLPFPLGSSYNLVHGPGAVLNINTRSKDGWGYALQPIPSSHHTPTASGNSTNFKETIAHAPEGPKTVEQNSFDWDVKASEKSFSNAPLYNPHANPHRANDEVTKAIFQVNEEDAAKFEGPIHVGEHGSYETGKNEYHRSYTLNDGTLVTENGELNTQPDGNIVFVKNGEYQYKRDDGNLVTVRWEADEHGFRIVN